MYDMQTFSDPSLTVYELEKQKLIRKKDVELAEAESAGKQIISIVETFRNGQFNHEFVFTLFFCFYIIYSLN